MTEHAYSSFEEILIRALTYQARLFQLGGTYKLKIWDDNKFRYYHILRRTCFEALPIFMEYGHSREEPATFKSNEVERGAFEVRYAMPLELADNLNPEFVAGVLFAEIIRQGVWR